MVNLVSDILSVFQYLPSIECTCVPSPGRKWSCLVICSLLFFSESMIINYADAILAVLIQDNFLGQCNTPHLSLFLVLLANYSQSGIATYCISSVKSPSINNFIYFQELWHLQELMHGIRAISRS